MGRVGFNGLRIRRRKNMYTIEKAKRTLKNGIEIYLQKDSKGKYCMAEANRLPFYLEGSPGIGKTEIVKQVADELGIGYVSFSLTHHTRNSILGLPVIKDLSNGKYTEYTMSEIIAKVLEKKEAGEEEGVLLLDEFSCVSDSILPAMLAFLQTKNIGMHTLPEGWIIVLCGNPPQYNRNARKFDAAILDRIRKVSVEFDAQVFISYAKEKEMHPAIIEYLSINPSNVYLCNTDNKELQLVTCRGWENLSYALYGIERLEKRIDKELVGQFIKSDEIAYDFYKFYILNNIGTSENDIKEIIKGKNISKYEEKYMECDFSVWWNMIDLFGNYLYEQHKGLEMQYKKIELADKLISELENTENISEQISQRLGFAYGEIYQISMWDKNNREYMECSELEKEILTEWYEMAELDIFTEEYEESYFKRILKWYEDNKKKVQAEFRTLSKEISNVFLFVNKKDIALIEKFYHIINNSEIFLMTMVETKNKEYFQICKENYAMEA